MLHSLLVACFLLAADRAVTPGEPPKLDPRQLAAEGFGPVKMGMTVAEAGKALRLKLLEAAPARAGGPACHTADAADLPGVSFVIESGKIVRIDVYGVSYQTAKGVRSGMKEAEAKARYPGIQVTPHKYDTTGHYLTQATPDQKLALVFETDGTQVTSMHAGVFAAATRSDPCP